MDENNVYFSFFLGMYYVHPTTLSAVLEGLSLKKKIVNRYPKLIRSVTSCRTLVTIVCKREIRGKNNYKY